MAGRCVLSPLKRSWALALLLAAWPWGSHAQSDPDVRIEQLNHALMAAYQAGHYAQAAARAEELLQALEAQLGQEDLGLATVMGNLAMLYGMTGHLDEAQPLYAHPMLRAFFIVVGEGGRKAADP
jgi:hypothetical protein